MTSKKVDLFARIEDKVTFEKIDNGYLYHLDDCRVFVEDEYSLLHKFICSVQHEEEWRKLAENQELTLTITVT